MHIKFDFGVLLVLLSVVAVFLVGCLAGSGCAAEPESISLSGWMQELENAGNTVEIIDVGWDTDYDVFEIVDTYVGGSFDLPYEWVDYTYIEDLVLSYDAQSACILAVNDGFSVDTTYYLLLLYDSPLTYVFIYITIEDEQYYLVAQGSKVEVPEAIVTSEFYTSYDVNHILVFYVDSEHASPQQIYGGYYSDYAPYWYTSILSWIFGASENSGTLYFYGFDGELSSTSLLVQLHTVHFDSSLAGAAAPTETPTVMPTPSTVPTVLPTSGMFEPISYPSNPSTIPTLSPYEPIVIPTLAVPQIPDNDITRGLFLGYKNIIDNTIGFVCVNLNTFEADIYGVADFSLSYIRQISSYVQQVTQPLSSLMASVFAFIPAFVWVFMGVFAVVFLIVVILRIITHGFSDGFWTILGGGK